MQGLSLTAISFLMRTVHIFYRSYISGEIGAGGVGLFQLIFSIFMLAVTLCTSGISLAVTRLVSSAIVSGRRNEIRSIVNRCLLFCLSLSFLVSFFFLFFSNFAARVFLGNVAAAPCLQILGLGLPFMSLCTCMKGYFLAVDESVSCALADTVEQAVSIGGTFILFSLFPITGIEFACMLVMIASTVGEATSFIIDFIFCRLSFRKNTPKDKVKNKNVLNGMVHIALPCTFSSAARSLINTGENVLIPHQLQRAGYSYDTAMTQYGLLQGMAVPILYFPSFFLGSFATLLIPKITKERETGHKNAVAHISLKAISTSLSFGVITAAVFYMFSDSLGLAFYKNAEVGVYIKMLAPLIPLMYLDIVVDCLLKGLDEQLNSMKYNIMDSSLRVMLILLLMSTFGINSYIAIIFFSTIFNAGLSVLKVASVTKFKKGFLLNFLYQIPFAILSVMLAKELTPQFDNQIIYLIFGMGVSYLCYIIFLSIKKLVRL